MKLFLLVLLVGFFSVPRGNADCVCIKEPDRSAEKVRSDRRKAFDKATVVFEGKVVALDSYRVTFRLRKRWKGPTQDEVKLSTGAVRGYDGTPLPKECSYRFELGEEYLVYVNGADDNMEAVSCLTFQIDSASDEEKTLDQIRAHETIHAKSGVLPNRYGNNNPQGPGK
jgi:hypothetical protein